MSTRSIFGLMGVVMVLLGGCANSANQCPPPVCYDLRQDLQPQRLTVAMWDFSYLFMHYPGGAYEDFGKVLDELKDRGFNTVRIDAFPLSIADLKEQNKKTGLLAASPYDNWGQRDRDVEHDYAGELVEFVAAAQARKLKVILSTWNFGPREKFATREKYWQAWETVLDLLAEKGLLANVVYVDLDQEFPFFSPFWPEIERQGIAKEKEAMDETERMEAAGRGDMAWNARQLAYVKEHMTTSLEHFQRKYPYLRFTFSLTSFKPEVRSLNVPLDVLEVHLWMNLKRLGVRTDFDKMEKSRDPKPDYKAYMRQVHEMLAAMGPMLKADMHNQMQFARDWGREAAVPVVVTEAWGPWWHLDHPDLTWDWLSEWCQMCVGLSAEYGFWGATPWNYSYPYFKNWDNKKWYRQVNGDFLKH